MTIQVDAYLTKPGIVSKKGQLGAILTFERMDPDTRVATGEPFHAAMTLPDVMVLLRVLLEVASRYQLPIPAAAPIHTKLPDKSEKN